MMEISQTKKIVLMMNLGVLTKAGIAPLPSSLRMPQACPLRVDSVNAANRLP
jgi:hypothetical protein